MLLFAYCCRTALQKSMQRSGKCCMTPKGRDNYHAPHDWLTDWLNLYPNRSSAWSQGKSIAGRSWVAKKWNQKLQQRRMKGQWVWVWAWVWTWVWVWVSLLQFKWRQQEKMQAKGCSKNGTKQAARCDSLPKRPKPQKPKQSKPNVEDNDESVVAGRAQGPTPPLPPTRRMHIVRPSQWNWIGHGIWPRCCSDAKSTDSSSRRLSCPRRWGVLGRHWMHRE